MAQQIIYTSTRRGIEREGSGYQVFSYSPGVPAIDSLGTQYRAIFAYEPPRGENLPHLPTPEEQCLFPKRFLFKEAPENGKYLLSLNTYIGRDYPENSNRPGNFLSHVVFEDPEAMDARPYAFFQSPALLDSIDLELVRSEQQPELLDEIELRTGIWEVDLREFLSDESNRDVLVQLLTCALSYQDPVLEWKHTPIMIAHDEDRFIELVGALQEILPLPIAQKLSFSTYEWDLSRHSTRIVRLRPGQETAVQNVYLFNGDTYQGPELLERTQDFARKLVDMASMSQDSLDLFHDYLVAHRVDDLDSRMIAVHTLSMLLNSHLPVSMLPHESITEVLDFARDHCDRTELTALGQSFVTFLLGGIPDDETSSSIHHFLRFLTTEIPDIVGTFYTQSLADLTASIDDSTAFSDAKVLTHKWVTTQSLMPENRRNLADPNQLLGYDVLRASWHSLNSDALLKILSLTLENSNKPFSATAHQFALGMKSEFGPAFSTLPLRHGYKGLGVCGLTHRDALGITKRPDRENTWSGLLHWYLHLTNTVGNRYDCYI